MRRSSADAANYETPYKNKGNHYDDGNNRHGTDRVWGVHSITRKKKDAKATQKVKRTQSPSKATKVLR